LSSKEICKSREYFRGHDLTISQLEIEDVKTFFAKKAPDISYVDSNSLKLGQGIPTTTNNSHIEMDNTILLSMFLGMFDQLLQNGEFEYRTLHKNARMSKVRKVIEGFEVSLISKIKNAIVDDLLPVDDKMIREYWDEVLNELHQLYKDNSLRQLDFESVFNFYLESIRMINERFEDRLQVNCKASKTKCDIFLDQMLQTIPEVSNLTECDILDPLIFEKFDSGIHDIIENYLANVEGSSKCNSFFI